MLCIGRPEPADLLIFYVSGEKCFDSEIFETRHILFYIYNKIVGRAVKIAWQTVCLRPLIY